MIAMYENKYPIYRKLNLIKCAQKQVATGKENVRSCNRLKHLHCTVTYRKIKQFKLAQWVTHVFTFMQDKIEIHTTCSSIAAQAENLTQKEKIAIDVKFIRIIAICSVNREMQLIRPLWPNRCLKCLQLSTMLINQWIIHLYSLLMQCQSRILSL